MKVHLEHQGCIRAYDHNSPNDYKSVEGLTFKEVNQENAYRRITGDSTALPWTCRKISRGMQL